MVFESILSLQLGMWMKGRKSLEVMRGTAMARHFYTPKSIIPGLLINKQSQDRIGEVGIELRLP
jgi:hypothetical protein